MGWNGSGGGSTPAQPKVTAKKPSPIRGLVAGLVVVGLAAGAYFSFFVGSDNPQKEATAKERGKIKEVKPAAAPTNKVVAAEKVVTKPVAKPGPGGGRPSRFVDGHYVSPDPAYAEMKKRMDEQAAKDPFDHFCDSLICNIVCAEPGDSMLPVPIDGQFEKEFLESLKTPIIPTKDDPPEIAEKKRAVNEAKIWLKQQMDDGKDIKKILTEARDKINGLSDLTMYYRGEIIDLKRKEGVTGEELRDYVNAANKIIDKYVADNFDFPHNAEKAHVTLPKGFLK